MNAKLCESKWTGDGQDVMGEWEDLRWDMMKMGGYLLIFLVQGGKLLFMWEHFMNFCEILFSKTCKFDFF